MDHTNEHELLQVRKEEFDAVRKFYSLSTADLNAAIDSILAWYEKQTHLPPNGIDRNSAERILIVLGKGSVEKTKHRIDRLFTVKGMIPELSQNRDIRNPELQSTIESFMLYPLPKLDDNRSRVYITKVLTTDYENISLLQYFKVQFMISEIRLLYEYCLGDTYIIDLGNTKLGLLTKMNPIHIRKADILSQEGFGIKIFGIHFVNAPSFVDKFVAILKQSLKPKLAERIMVHRSYEELHKHVAKRILPSDYNGDEISLEKLGEKWKTVLRSEAMRELFIRSESLVSNESKRIGDKFTEDMFGIPGSFRSIEVD